MYDGQKPYNDSIRMNISHLVRVTESGDWTLLRREPPAILGIVNAMSEIEKLVRDQFSAMLGMKIEFDESNLMPG